MTETRQICSWRGNAFLYHWKSLEVGSSLEKLVNARCTNVTAGADANRLSEQLSSRSTDLIGKRPALAAIEPVAHKAEKFFCDLPLLTRQCTKSGKDSRARVRNS